MAAAANVDAAEHAHVGDRPVGDVHVPDVEQALKLGRLLEA